MRGTRQGARQSSVNKSEGRADCVAQEYGSVEDRVAQIAWHRNTAAWRTGSELKGKADKLCYFLHSFIFPLFYSA